LSGKSLSKKKALLLLGSLLVREFSITKKLVQDLLECKHHYEYKELPRGKEENIRPIHEIC
jgi:hypothetical protein